MPDSNRLRHWLGLERNILVLLSGIVILGLGEEMWMRFVPKYLELLGATAWIVAAYGTLKDLLDAVYQYPGGWLADRLGRRRALVLFTLLAVLGYFFYLISNSWHLVLVGTLFVMAWSSLTLPATFAVIGDTLESSRRAIGFGVNAILKRIPIVLAPFLGGWLMVRYGFVSGFKIGLVATIFLAFASIFVLFRYYEEKPRIHDSSRAADIWRSMSPEMKRLLIADCLARWAEGIPKVFVILFAMNHLGVSTFQFGWLTSLQQIASIVVYVPIAKLSDRLNRKPFVLVTFAFFAFFPLALVSATNLLLTILAFVIAGLREFGEPARKAMIVDFAPETARGRTVGLYYLIRGLVVFPAPLIGGWLWTINPHFPFYIAFLVGVIGCIAYAALARGDDATIKT